MLTVDYTSNNKVTNKPPRITIIERKGGRPKKKQKILLTPAYCRHCGNELSDKAIEVEMDLCPDCGGLIDGFIAKHRD